MSVRPKKHLGQHFLTDQRIAERICSSLQAPAGHAVLEIGPGKGILTKYLLNTYEENLYAVEYDQESVRHLEQTMPLLTPRLLAQDVLKLNFDQYPNPLAIIGNFPYNISSPLFFMFMQRRGQIDEVVCMIQKEVADRIVAPPGNKTYGILSVLLQAFFDVSYLFTVKPGSFFPPPKVQSSVIRLVTHRPLNIGCDEALFKRVVKQAFQNRRKTLRNALKPLNLSADITGSAVFNQRAEQLSYRDFIALTNQIADEGDRNEI